MIYYLLSIDNKYTTYFNCMLLYDFIDYLLYNIYIYPTR